MRGEVPHGAKKRDRRGHWVFKNQRSVEKTRRKILEKMPETAGKFFASGCGSTGRRHKAVDPIKVTDGPSPLCARGIGPGYLGSFAVYHLPVIPGKIDSRQDRQRDRPPVASIDLHQDS